MKKKLVLILLSIVGVIIGPAVFTLASFTRTQSNIDVIHISHFVLFFLLGYLTHYIIKNSHIFFKYWIPISFSLLYASIFFLGMENLWDWVSIILEGILMYTGYFLGYLIKNKKWLIVAPIIGVLLILFAIHPIYVRNMYEFYYTNNKGIEKRRYGVLNIEKATIQNIKRETIDISSFLEKDENLVLFTFVGCKPCREKLNFIEKNIKAISEKKSVIVIHDGKLDSFSVFVKGAKKNPNLSQFYDSSGIFSGSISTYNQKLYPIEFTVNKDWVVQDYVRGWDNNTCNLYLKNLLE